MYLCWASPKGRRASPERYFFDDEEVALKPGSEGVLLLQHIRDEAHRFAITGHRARRAKARNVTELDEIDGVGPKRRKALLMHFGSISAIKGASLQEIARVPGINEKLAADIHAALHGE
jgi:excinuclease ABC subunit C